MLVDSPQQAPDRNLAMELVRVTEAAALAASRWMGRGDKEGADGAAVTAGLAGERLHGNFPDSTLLPEPR